ncbi:MAG: hypothetical protein IPI38_05535 [Gemmatimonadetes bacterium]|nr:hypothetical protein [Gemmatimonadota bacterium]MBK6778390.1 hypothetical protein [Gemmatimonadota bacterium]MBK6779874.1 hypothetical protein [Gemmatimonadota bacterium]MBK7349298.1 hypothetical protein [Gemmatimonadota bacterium]MBK7714866.1 hypothetical protein [Gemmatimonadota bacterium]
MWQAWQSVGKPALLCLGVVVLL